MDLSRSRKSSVQAHLELSEATVGALQRDRHCHSHSDGQFDVIDHGQPHRYLQGSAVVAHLRVECAPIGTGQEDTVRLLAAALPTSDAISADAHSHSRAVC